METQTTELVLASEISALEVFTGGKVQEVVERIKAHVSSIATDATTDAGREAITSLAYKVTRSKTTIDNVGKGIKDPMMEDINKIDAVRRYARTALEALADDIKKPVTEYNLREAARVKAIQTKIDAIKALVRPDMMTYFELCQAIDSLDEINPAEFADYAEQVSTTMAETKALLTERLEPQRKYEADQKELEVLRQEKAAREAAEAKAAADAKHQQEIADASERAAMAERNRIEVEAKRKEAEQAKRDADENHKRAVNNDIKAALMAVDASDLLTDEQATLITRALVMGQIPNTKVTY